MDTPPEILAISLQRAKTDIGNSIVNNEDIRQRVELICRNIRKMASVQLGEQAKVLASHNAADNKRVQSVMSK